MDGTVVGHLRGYKTELVGLPSDILMFDPNGSAFVLGPYGVDPRPVPEASAPPFFRWGAPTGCTAIPSAADIYLGTTRVVLCGPTDHPPGWERFVAIHDGGLQEPLIDKPASGANGSWAWALWNHAGDRLLAQWTDEQQGPTTYLLGVDLSPLPVLVGASGRPMESIGVGWAVGDDIVVHVPSRSTELGPAGVYLVSTDRPPTLVYTTGEHKVEVGMWYFSSRWPAVYIDQPTSGSVFSEDLIQVRGFVTPGSTLRVAHATSVAVADDGSWSATVELEPGPNYLEAVATLDGVDGAAAPVFVEYSP
jgi:hypothetical protein